jgi:hypothetical protein
LPVCSSIGCQQSKAIVTLPRVAIKADSGHQPRIVDVRKNNVQWVVSNFEEDPGRLSGWMKMSISHQQRPAMGRIPIQLIGK